MPDLHSKPELDGEILIWKLYKNAYVRAYCDSYDTCIDIISNSILVGSLTHWHPDEDDMFDELYSLGKKGNILVIQNSLLLKGVFYKGAPNEYRFDKLLSFILVCLLLCFMVVGCTSETDEKGYKDITDLYTSTQNEDNTYSYSFTDLDGNILFEKENVVRLKICEDEKLRSIVKKPIYLYFAAEMVSSKELKIDESIERFLREIAPISKTEGISLDSLLNKKINKGRVNRGLANTNVLININDLEDF